MRDHKTGILANGERAFHLASLVSNLSREVTLLTAGKRDFNAEQLSKLKRHNIGIIEEAVTAIEHQEGQVENVVFSSGRRMPFRAVYAALPFKQHSDIPVSLGCELTEQGHIKVDGSQKTTIEGVFACGDNSAMMRSVANAVYTGNLAGAMVNRELTSERF